MTDRTFTEQYPGAVTRESWTIVQRHDDDELTVITATDLRGRLWTSICRPDGFERIVTPTGLLFDSWSIDALPPFCAAFVEWLIEYAS